MARKPKRIPLDLTPGTHPSGGPDSTALSSARCIATDKVYFKQADRQTFVRPIPGWWEVAGAGDVAQEAAFFLELSNPVGVPKTQAWHQVAGTDWYVMGTTRKLYALDGGTNQVYDITPLVTSGVAAANGIATTNGSSVITVTRASHGLKVGDHVEISGAATTGGIPDTEINQVFAVKAVPTSGTFTVNTGTNASSTVSGGGGAGTVLFRQVPYSATRTWSFDNFGDILVLCPGEGGAVYEWDGDPDLLPAAVTNAPTANWVFVSNNAVVALGAAGQPNRIQVCGIGERTVWAAGPGSTAWSDDVEGVSELVSQARSRDTNVLFSHHEALTFKYVGLPNLWEWDYLMTSDGIGGPTARTAIDDVVYWQGWSGLPYWFDGSSPALIPGNTCVETMRAGGYQNADAFVRPMPEYRQVWFYYAPNKYAIFDYEQGHWTLGTHNATGAENPARRRSPGLRGLFAYGTSDVATAALYEEHPTNGTYATEDAGNRKSYVRLAYRSLDENRSGEVLELAMDVASPPSDGFAVTLYTADNPVNEGAGTGAGGMTTSTYAYDPSTGTLLVDAVGKYWSWRIEKDQGTTRDFDFVIGKLTEAVQPGVPL